MNVKVPKLLIYINILYLIVVIFYGLSETFIKLTEGNPNWIIMAMMIGLMASQLFVNIEIIKIRKNNKSRLSKKDE